MSGHPRHRRWRAPPALLARAQELRRKETAAEAQLWKHLRGRGLAGHKFRRQHPIGRFIVDFCCPERRLVVEIDGPVHDQQVEYDHARTQALAIAGYRVVRFTNTQVMDDLQLTLDTLLALLATDAP